jgi:hypothetical protein
MTSIPLRDRFVLELETGGVLALACDLFTYYVLCAFVGAVQGLSWLRAWSIG